MEFHDAFSLALFNAWTSRKPEVSIWDFGPMYCMGGEL